MKDKKELEKFIGDKLAEIRKEYDDYLSQYENFKLPETWRSKDHHLCVSIFSDSYSFFSCMNGCMIDGKEKTLYMIDYHEKYGSFDDRTDPSVMGVDKLKEFDATTKIGKTE